MTRLMAILLDKNGAEKFVVYDNALEITFDSLDRGSLDNVVSWGVFSNRGNITCYDYENKFAKIYEADQSLNGYKVEIRRVYGASSVIVGRFWISDANYDKNTQKITLSLSDGLTEWQNKSITLNISWETQTLYDIFLNIKTAISNAHGINIYITNNAQAILEQISIYCPYRRDTVTVWGILNEICAISMCRISTNVYGNAVLDYEQPILSNPIAVRARNVLNIAPSTAKHKTAVTNASISVLARTVQVAAEIFSPKLAYLFATYDLTHDEVLKKFPELTNIADDGFNTSQSSIPTPNGERKMAMISTENPLPISDGKIPLEVTDWYMRCVKKTAGSSTETTELVSPTADYSTDENTISFKLSVFPAAVNEVGTTQWWYDRATISALGTYCKDLGSDDFYFGDDTTSAVQLASSVWLQYANRAGDNYHYQWLFDNIKNRYEDGVECLEISCNVDDYYFDGTTTMAISKASYFQKYQTVVPYVNRGGYEQPYRTDSNGNPVEYIIVGTSFSYRGHVTQKLYLQEKNY